MEVGEASGAETERKRNEKIEGKVAELNNSKEDKKKWGALERFVVLVCCRF